MSYFESDPDLILHTEADLKNALANEDQIFAGIPKSRYAGKVLSVQGQPAKIVY